jgi:hypothetical protein
MNLINLAQQSFEKEAKRLDNDLTNNRAKRDIAKRLSRFMRTSDGEGASWLGLENESPALAQVKLDNLVEFLSKTYYVEQGMGSVYNKGASDKEMHEDKKRLDSKIIRLDAGEGAFLERDLEWMDPTKYEELYKDNTQWRALFPVKNLNSQGADNYKYQMYEVTGKAKPLSNGATDIAMANSKNKWYEQKIHDFGLGYDYTVQEIQAYITGNQPLETERIRAVTLGYDNTMNDLIWNGDTDLSVEGYINHSAITPVTAPTRETVVTWVDKVAAASGGMNVVRDIRDFVKAANVASQNRFWNAQAPGVIGIPLDQYHLIVSETLNTANASNISIKDYCIQSFAGLSAIEPVIELDGAGAGATDVALGWIPQSNLTEVVEGTGTMWLPMQAQGFRYVFNSWKRMCGPVLRYVDAMYQMDGI